MKRIAKLAGFTLICFFVAAVIFYWLPAQFLAWVMAQPSQVAAAIIAFAGTVIAGISAVVISQQRTKAREISEAHRPNKTKLYAEFITQVVCIMRDYRGGRTPDAAASKHLEDFFFDFTTRVMLWVHLVSFNITVRFEEFLKNRIQTFFFWWTTFSKPCVKTWD